MFKCNRCFTIFGDEDAVIKDEVAHCPICDASKEVEKMCPLDRLCTCADSVQPGVYFCEKCGKPVCKCGSHDVAQVSRVTGYLSDVGGWNEAKKAELKDRQRVTVA